MEKLMQKAQEFLKSNDIPLRIKESKEHNYGLANCNPANRTIELSIEAIIEKARQWRISSDEYIVLVMAHEVGHFYDTEGEVISKEINQLLGQINDESNYECEKKILELVKQRELNAWENGKKFIPDYLESHYETMNLMNLEYRYCNTKINIMALKYNKKEKKLTMKLSEQSREIRRLMDEKIELMSENFILKFGENNLPKF